MDSVITEHAISNYFLVFQNLERSFHLSNEKMYFLNQLVSKKGELIYLNGNKEGFEIEYDSYYPGTKTAVRKWKANKREGLEIFYSYSDYKEAQANWKNDVQEGLEISYYDSGAKRLETIWKNGKKECLEVKYYESGKKQFERIHKDGVLISEIDY